MIPHNILLIFLIVAVSLSKADAQVQGIRLLGKEKRIDLPMVQIGGFILVKLDFGKHLPLTFLFDTGATNTILFDKTLAYAVGLPFEKEIDLMGTDLMTKVKASIVRGAKIKLSRCQEVEKDIIVLHEDITNIKNTIGEEVHGIIGGDFLKGLTIRINYKKGKISLMHPDALDRNKLLKRGYDEIDIIQNQNKCYINLQYQDENHTHLLKMLLDTGAALTALIDQSTDTTLVLPNKSIGGELGVGLGGSINGYIAQLPKLTIGNIELVNTIGYFQSESSKSIFPSVLQQRNGIIGNMMLRLFDIVIDYTNSKLYIKPNKNFYKKPKYDKSGLVVTATGPDLHTYVIKSVLIGSVASEQDLREGDIIIKYNYLPTRFISLNYLINRFTKKEGKKIKLTILRDGNKLVKEFRLRNLF